MEPCGLGKGLLVEIARFFGKVRATLKVLKNMFTLDQQVCFWKSVLMISYHLEYTYCGVL